MRNAAARRGVFVCSLHRVSRLLKNASRVKIEFCASRVSEGNVFLRPPILGSQGGVAPFFNNLSGRERERTLESLGRLDQRAENPRLPYRMSGVGHYPVLGLRPREVQLVRRRSEERRV